MARRRDIAASRVRLDSEPGALPLGFHASENLAGIGVDGYVTPSDLPSFSPEVQRDVRALGVGPLRVRVTGSEDRSMRGEPVTEWHSSMLTLGGFADMQALGRTVADIVRRHVGLPGTTETPREVYVTRIVVEQPAPVAAPKPRPKRQPTPTPMRKRAPVKRRAVRYFDTETGRFVAKAKYERSRRAIRAHARKAGNAAKQGRYVRRYL